jgi:hypothetical protein
MAASPRFHRWHHISAAEGRDKNFAGLLTNYVPSIQLTQFGIPDAVPATLVWQFNWQLLRRQNNSICDTSS